MYTLHMKTTIPNRNLPVLDLPVLDLTSQEVVALANVYANGLKLLKRNKTNIYPFRRKATNFYMAIVPTAESEMVVKSLYDKKLITHHELNIYNLTKLGVSYAKTFYVMSKV